jgi:agmatinase
VVGDQPFYITIDVDGIDPAYTPGTGTPEVGGLTPLQVQMMLRELKGLNIVGGDVVEVAPQYDPTTNTAHVAAQLLFELFALIAVSR